MSWQGPVGFNGPQGFPGCTGPNGLQGTPYGPPGTTFYKSGAIPVPSDFSGLSGTLGPANSGYYFLFKLTSSPTIDFSTYTPVPSTDSGVFWSFKNTSGSTLNVNIFPPTGATGLPSTSSTGAGVYYNGNPIATTLTVVDGAGFTIVYSVDPVTSIQYFIVI